MWCVLENYSNRHHIYLFYFWWFRLTEWQRLNLFSTFQDIMSIVVPLDTERVKPIVFWTSATQILYNLAIAAAAVNSF